MMTSVITREDESDHNTTLKSPTSQRGGSPTCKMNGSATTNNKIFPPNNHGGPNHQVAVETSSTHQHYGSLFEVHSKDSDDQDALDSDDVDRMLPGVLAKGAAYTIKQVIFHGYLDKKGSGFDWIGSRAWKPRWAVLVKARTDGHDVDVPLLQIFWDYHSPSPSTVISLDSAVILPENNLGNIKSSTDHPFRFQIRNVKKSVNPETSLQMTRIFSCSEQSERDEWVYAINQALLNYEKEKASARRLSSLSTSAPHTLFRSWIKEDVMPQSKSKPNRQRKFPSPPLVPS